MTDTPPAIDCDDALMLAAARAERPLEAADATALDAHLATCDVCRSASDDALDDDDDWISIARIPVRSIDRGGSWRGGDASADGATPTVTDARGGRDGQIATDTVGDDIPALPIIDPGVYTWGETIGAGGMGRVVEARDRRLGRTVAIKELRAGGLEDRFEIEARITARLQHPAIVNIHEAGRWPSGEPFYAMKLVKGSSLSDAVRSTDSFAERVALLPNVISIVEAIAYAHSEGVLHRDVKPSNIVIGPFGETVVIDWGLAKDVSDIGNAEPVGPFRGAADGATAAGLGTPQYMPPEQARGDQPDERFDVYALGATLYHVLAGAPPYGYAKPLELLDRLERGAPPPIRDVAPETPSDLAAIVDKAMARDAGDRYPSAEQLADDLRRYQAGKLVSAAVYSTWGLAKRWLAQHRALVVAIAVLFAVGAVGATYSVTKILGERAAAERARDRAHADRATAFFEQGRREMLDGRPMRALPYLLEAYDENAANEPLELLLGEAMVTLDAQIAVFDSELTEFVDVVALSPDGARVAYGTAPGRVHVYSVDGDRLSGHEHGADVEDLAWSEDGGHLVSASLDNTAAVNGDDSGRFFGHGNAVRFARATSGIATTVGDDRVVRRWHLDGTQIDSRDISAFGRILDMDPQGTRLLTTQGYGANAVTKVISLDAATFGQVATLDLDPDAAHLGHRIAAVASGDATMLIDLSTGEKMPFELANASPVTAMTATADGAVLAIGDSTGAIGLWDTARGVELGRVVAHRRAITDLSFDAAGARLASSGAEGTVRVWDARAIAAATSFESEPQVAREAFAVAGNLVAFSRPDLTIAVVDATTGRIVSELEGHTCKADSCRWQPHLNMLAFDASGSRLVSSGHDGTVRVWDVASGRQLHVRNGLVFDTDISPDGEHVVSAHGNNALLWRADGTGTDHQIEGSSFVSEVRFSSDGRSFVVAERSGAARTFRLDGTQVDGNDGDGAPADRVAVGPELIAVGDDAGRLWAGSAQFVHAHPGPILALAVDARGAHLATASDDGVTVWRTENLERSLTLAAQNVLDLAFGPSGHVLAVATETDVTLWDLDSGATLRRWPMANGKGSGIRFTSDGDALIVAASRALFVQPLATENRDLGSLAALHERFGVWDLVDGRLVPRRRLAIEQRGGRDAKQPPRVQRWYDFSADTIDGHRSVPSVKVSEGTVAHRSYRAAWSAFDKGNWDAAHARMSEVVDTYTTAVPAELVREHALFAARAASPAAGVIALVRNHTPEQSDDRFSWLEQLLETYDHAGVGDDAARIADALLADAAPHKVAWAHTARWRRLISANEPEAAVAEAVEAAKHAGDADGFATDVTAAALDEMAKVFHRTYILTFDARYGRAARESYRAYIDYTTQPDKEQATAWLDELTLEMTLPPMSGMLDKKDLRRGFRRRMQQMRECYERVLQTDPDTQGELKVQLFIDNSGKVTHTKLMPLPGDHGLSAVSRCIDETVRMWSFPRPTYAPTTGVDYKVRMTPGDSATE